MQVKRFGTVINFYSDAGEYLHLWVESDGRICNIKTTNHLDRWRTGEEADKFLREWLPQSGWLDVRAVELAANRSDMCALLSSITHWRQIVVNFDSYFDAEYKGSVGCDAGFCALCQRHLSRGNCPLRTNCEGHCIGEWKDFYSIYSKEKLEKAIAMHNKLVETLNSLKKTELVKRSLSAGDIVEFRGAKRFIVRIMGKLYAVDFTGSQCAREEDFKACDYEYIGRCSDFEI